MTTAGLPRTVNADSVEHSARVFYREAARNECDKQRAQEFDKRTQKEVVQVESERQKVQEPEERDQKEVARVEPEKQKVQEMEKRPQAETGRTEPETQQKNTSISSSPRPSNSASKNKYMEGIPLSPMAKLPTTQRRLKELCDEVRENMMI